MRRLAFIAAGVGTLAIASIVIAQDESVRSVIGNVFLQSTTPGEPQAGHATITGTFRAGQVNVSQGTATTIPVIGNNTAEGAGTAIGGSFSSGQQSGIALRGTATSTTGFNIGVLGEARSPNGTGVTGKSSTGIGVFGLTEGTGAGVWGRSTNIGTPAAILENTSGGDAVRLFGQLRMMNASQIIGHRKNGTTAFSLTSPTDQANMTFSAGPFSTQSLTDATFASFRMSRNAITGVRLLVDPNGLGRVEASVKNFVQPDPDDIGQDIVYASLEGPEAAAYVRGTAKLVNGVARIALPRHFQSVATLPGMTVQLTPLSRSSRGLAVTAKSLSFIEVGELGAGTGNYEFDWRVEAVRRGFTDYRVRRPWDTALPADVNRAKAMDARRRLAREVYGIDYPAQRP